jgi:hypothetical protein
MLSSPATATIPVSAFDWDAGRISRRLHAIADARQHAQEARRRGVGDER